MSKLNPDKFNPNQLNHNIAMHTEHLIAGFHPAAIDDYNTADLTRIADQLAASNNPTERRIASAIRAQLRAEAKAGPRPAPPSRFHRATRSLAIAVVVTYALWAVVRGLS